MATLPRARAHNSNGASALSSPFSTSPRKLQEMSLTADGHDVTSASGISMKQYEEQLSGLRKENFNLKYRVFYLEEKLGTGAPPAVQGLLEHNVRLQVEVQELRHQLSDKQQLLAAAAEAIDVLEQQGSISTDSVENVSMNNSIVPNKEIVHDQVQEHNAVTDDTCAGSESAGDYLAVTVNNNDMDELVKLRREYPKALLMIKRCLNKIQQQGKEIKRMGMSEELKHAQVSDSQLEKYQEILKCKDEHIKDLEGKVRDLQKHVDSANDAEDTGNLQQLLTRRLQGLAYFLDKLLSHKCVLGEDKKRLAESILEQSLALPVGLELDESMAPEELTMDESTLEMSQSLRIEDLTAMFGHHVACEDRHPHRKHRVSPDVISESECWSEPDRNVSLARVGLCHTGVANRESHSDSNKHSRSRRAKLSNTSHGSNDDILTELNARCESLQQDKLNLHEKLQHAITDIEQLTENNRLLKETLDGERANAADNEKHVEALRSTISSLESRLKDVEQKLADSVKLVDVMKTERHELEATFVEKERALRRAADEATLQASQVALERARAQNDRLRIEKELEDTRDKLSSVLEINSQLEIEVTRRVAQEIDNNMALHEALPSEEERATSPDQGIDSDRLSSLEQNDALALSPRSLYEENVTLKQKLARMKATLAETLVQVNAANVRKISIERAICREIHKTHGVLRVARDQFQNQK